jgi:hypothetical protein
MQGGSPALPAPVSTEPLMICSGQGPIQNLRYTISNMNAAPLLVTAGLFGVLAGPAYGLGLDQRVSFTSLPAPAAKVFEQLGSQTGVGLFTAPQTANEVLLVGSRT